MFVWRKRASAVWLAANEAALWEEAGQRLAIVSKPEAKVKIVELAALNRDELEKIKRRFGGKIEKLPRDWLKRFLRGAESKPLRIGKRLQITTSGTSANRSLIIPATVAFGTGRHPTTAMALRFLERLSRFWAGRTVSSVVDLGTGSGILALAAARFGAKRITAIDNDPLAIAAAKENARRNKIAKVDFRIADVRRWKFPAKIDIVTANLFSELLIQILPKLKCAEWVILSGVLREQEPQVVCALKRNGIVLTETRRCGKWTAFLGRLPNDS